MYNFKKFSPEVIIALNTVADYKAQNNGEGWKCFDEAVSASESYEAAKEILKGYLTTKMYNSYIKNHPTEESQEYYPFDLALECQIDNMCEKMC